MPVSTGLEIDVVPQRGRSLCWAEAGYAVGMYLTNRKPKFCAYMSDLLPQCSPDCLLPGGAVKQACDEPGYVSMALADGFQVHTVRVSPRFRDVVAEIESGRPLLLLVNGQGFQINHVKTVVGFVRAYSSSGRWSRAVELLDTAERESRELVASDWLWAVVKMQRWLWYAVKRPPGLEARQAVPLTNWTDDEVAVEELDLTPPDESCFAAVRSLLAETGWVEVPWTLKGAFRLFISRFPGLSRDAPVTVGIRTFLELQGRATLAVDLVRSEEGLKVCRLLKGAIVESSVRAFTARAGEIASGYPRFLEWPDLGTQILLWNSNTPGLESEPQAMLLGPRRWLGADSGGESLSLREAVARLRTHLLASPPIDPD